jgi:hypothetical protein
MIIAYREPGRAHGKQVMQALVGSLRAKDPAALRDLKAPRGTLKRLSRFFAFRFQPEVRNL